MVSHVVSNDYYYLSTEDDNTGQPLQSWLTEHMNDNCIFFYQKSQEKMCNASFSLENHKKRCNPDHHTPDCQSAVCYLCACLHMQGQARPYSLAPKAFRLVQVRNAQVTHRLIDMRIRSWCTDRFTSCAEPCASAASARFCYPACGLPGSGWPLHRLRTACAQSLFSGLTIKRTEFRFLIVKKNIKLVV